MGQRILLSTCALIKKCCTLMSKNLLDLIVSQYLHVVNPKHDSLHHKSYLQFDQVDHQK